MSDPIQSHPDNHPAVTELNSQERPPPFLKMAPKGSFRYGPVSIALIGACIIVALFSGIGSNTERLLPLFISLPPGFGPGGVLPEVRGGEFWRLLTPVFIHFGVLHIVFNMIWVKDIGGAVENRDGSGWMAALVVFTALCSNIGQYFWSGPIFGGMSGVVYGLFGYVWLRSALDRQSGYYMPGQTVMVMLVWFVLCALGIIPHVANAAHGFGLAAGALCGFAASKLSGRTDEQKMKQVLEREAP